MKDLQLSVPRQPLVTVVFALIVGGLFWQLDNSEGSGIQNRVGASFFLVTNMLFANAAATELFISERVIFIHESASGYYRVSTYFLAKVFCDLLPMRLIPTVIYCGITYWMIGFVQDAAKFFFFALTLLLTTLAGTSITFFYGATVGNSTLANLATTMSFVVMLIFGGLFLNINTLPTWLQWLQYISFARYGLNALSVNELKGLVFEDELTGRIENGTDYLQEQGIRHDEWGLWQNCVALAAYIIILMTLAYVQLRRIPKTK
ncbi:putative ATP-binding cassette sub-family G member 2 isoform X2 [Apostichopus japonicus]|uniref:Putative ATP-binding cassette sub-family G member 2 isoform X2 n=1 Tax=Stichopus japonicus TaxID=307972 RepID=A0A2G8KMA6_STIJA|nr:putative ATP-binding cassette sub-family G member 2 isoform X2 [Apostichopus japonicus]